MSSPAPSSAPSASPAPETAGDVFVFGRKAQLRIRSAVSRARRGSRLGGENRPLRDLCGRDTHPHASHVEKEAHRHREPSSHGAGRRLRDRARDSEDVVDVKRQEPGRRGRSAENAHSGERRRDQTAVNALQDGRRRQEGNVEIVQPLKRLSVGIDAPICARPPELQNLKLLNGCDRLRTTLAVRLQGRRGASQHGSDLIQEPLNGPDVR